MASILKKIETPYVDSAVLLNLLNDYKKPRDYILRMVKNKELIRLKNGFFLVSENIQKNIPFEQIANMLYGPSYISMEWALSFYGMIPERVTVITSMALGKDKEFETPVGTFTYQRLSSDVYYLGITQKSAVDFVGNFLIATPEKALVDLVYKTCKGFSKEELKEDLIESKRMDPDTLKQLNKTFLSDIASLYSSKSVKALVDLIGVI